MRDDFFWGYNGERIEGWRQHRYYARTRVPFAANPYTSLGVVIGVHFKDDPANESQTYTEYDVWLVYEMLTVRNVPMVLPYQGVTGGDEIVLTAAGGIPDATVPERYMEQVHNSDGDLVVISWIAGRFPAIIGSLARPRAGQDGAPWHGGSAEGPVARRTYNGARAAIDSDGNVQIDLEDTKSLTVNVAGTQVFTVTANGGTLVMELGQGPDLEKLVLGETLQTWWNTNVAGHVHGAGTLQDSTPAACTGATGGAVPTFPDANLTEKVKAEG